MKKIRRKSENMKAKPTKPPNSQSSDLKLNLKPC